VFSFDRKRGGASMR